MKYALFMQKLKFSSIFDGEIDVKLILLSAFSRRFGDQPIPEMYNKCYSLKIFYLIPNDSLMIIFMPLKCTMLVSPNKHLKTMEHEAIPLNYVEEGHFTAL